MSPQESAKTVRLGFQKWMVLVVDGKTYDLNPFTATRIYICAMKSTRIRDAHINMRVFVT